MNREWYKSTRDHNGFVFYLVVEVCSDVRKKLWQMGGYTPGNHIEDILKVSDHGSCHKEPSSGQCNVLWGTRSLASL